MTQWYNYHYLDNGETLVLKDGVLYHPVQTAELYQRWRNYHEYEWRSYRSHAEMQELGFVVSLENGAEITFLCNDTRRLSR